MAIIKVKNLTKIYNGLRAVDNISFEVKSGETFGILGPNGAGKTTTLEILEGIRKPTSGAAFIDKLSIKKDHEHIKEIIGVQLQATAFFDFLTVREILQLFADLYSNPINVKELIAEVMLEGKSKAYANKLSGGQKQRLSIAAALVNNPKVIFLDEPTTGLDPQARRSIWNLVRSIQKKGQTVVITTHYMEEAQKLCDRIAIMDNGKIIALDTPQGLINQSGINSKIEFKVLGEMRHNFAKTCGVKVIKKDHRIIIESKNPEHDLHKLMECIEKNQIKIVNLIVHQPTLEDVFLKLTGKKLRE